LLILRDTFTRRRISSIRGCYIEYKPDGVGRRTGAMASPSIIIVGAGLAGLAAARILQRRGGVVAVFEARERIGGRVWTRRDGFGGMHGEAGGELIDADQNEIRNLARELGLSEHRILRSGFAHYRLGQNGRRRMRSARSGWQATARAIAPLVRAYKINEQEWDGPIAQTIAARSVDDWLNETKATSEVRATAMTMRNFFLADPDDLSLLVYADQFATGGNPAGNTLYRLQGGNDRLPERMARALRSPVRLRHVVRRIAQTKMGVRVTVENDRRRSELSATCALVTAPAPLAAEIEFVPDLPEAQRDAFARLKYGPATKTLLQFDHTSWRRPGKPRACATDLEVGAVWDASENERGRKGMLAVLAGGGASVSTRSLLKAGGATDLVARLRFFGIGRARLVAFHSVSWEDDPWARGAYAVFGRSFAPSARRLLKMPSGRIFFAGEHTSVKWQGYMNGAIASGLRAAEEISALFL
jgi:monoamine oxidase